MKSETPIVSVVVKAFNTCGAIAWRQNSGNVPTRGGRFHGAPTGTPDVIGAMPGGRCFGVEVKTATGELRAAQIRWRKRAENMGVLFGVARSAREAVWLFKEWSGES